MFYSKQTGGFYDRAIHGNNIPADAVDVADAEYRALMEAQASGKCIQSDANGYPVAVVPPPPTRQQSIQQQISELEGQVTPRRMREATLGLDGGWLAGINTQIDTLRKSL